MPLPSQPWTDIQLIVIPYHEKVNRGGYGLRHLEWMGKVLIDIKVREWCFDTFKVGKIPLFVEIKLIREICEKGKIMSISPNDKCFKCGKSLIDENKAFSECENCGAQFCNNCFEEMEKNKDLRCPKCGKVKKYF